MSFETRSLAILGRQPALGVAELESLYGAEHIRPIVGAALLDLDVNEINFRRLGGTVKLAKILNILPTTKWSELEKYLIDNVPAHLKYVPDGKFTLGVSVYGLDVRVQTINSSLLKLKKTIRANGRSSRIVPNKQPELNAAQVLHNKLTSRGAWELLLVRDKNQTVLAQTMFVQDIEAYAARDQARPKRDAKIGMLPPKLAQIIINLANPPEGALLLDPFCGTGVILQEALLMGFSALGSDIDARMVEFAKDNIKWLHQQQPGLPEATVSTADATYSKWPQKIEAVASELYLGPPLGQVSEVNAISREISQLLASFLRNLAPQLGSKVRVSLAIPAWYQSSKRNFATPPIGNLTDMGYNHIKFQQAADEELIYWRPGQNVGRQLIVLEKV